MDAAPTPDRLGPDPDGSPDAAGPEMHRARALTGELSVPHVSLVLFAGRGAPAATHRGVLRGSDADLVALGDMVQTVGEGPAHDVLRTGRACVVDDLTSAGARWPLLTSTYPMPPRLRCLLALPLTQRPHGHPDDVLGVLVLARPGPPFTAADASRAGETAADITVMLLERVASADTEAVDRALDALLDPRAGVLSHAVGLTCQTRGVDPEEALRQLTARAFLKGSTLHRVAQQVLDRGP